jgi:RNA polymerase sigma-70 factor, ECF subfamily
VAAATRTILGNRPECDDVVAEVFVGIWRSPEKFQPDRGSLLSFLRLTAKSRRIDLVRSETARVRRERFDASGSEPAPASDDELLASEATAQLHDALAQLPPQEREPIELAYFHGMTYRDVAAHLEIPEGTVKSRIRSGLRKLRLDDQIHSQAGAQSVTADG